MTRLQYYHDDDDEYSFTEDVGKNANWRIIRKEKYEIK
jgi:hypothetical protein